MAALLVAAASPLHALDLRLPGSAISSGERSEALSSHDVPTGPWRNGLIPTIAAEGRVIQTAWKIPGTTDSTLQLLQPLRAQIIGAGFETVFECQTTACGGFDFRYGTDILPEPQMHVDLGDFRFLAARRAAANGSDWITLIVSRSADTGFVQITRIGAEPAVAPDFTLSSKSAYAPSVEMAPATSTLEDPLPVGLPQDDPHDIALATGQPKVLADLQFLSGEARLAQGDYPALARLAEWLVGNPAAQAELVGHTDSSGNAAANIALSLARAEAARAVLIGLHGVDPARITARGAGPAEPRADNATAEGRAKNRRVEVILTPTR